VRPLRGERGRGEVLDGCTNLLPAGVAVGYPAAYYVVFLDEMLLQSRYLSL